MYSFDIVSELKLQEVDNAVNQTTKELNTRFDFKNSKSEIHLEKDRLLLVSDNAHKMEALIQILESKLVKRQVSLQSLEKGRIEPAAGALVKCEIKLIQGISTEKAKELVQWIKSLKLKVTAAIQEEQVRVSGKSKDDLQTVISNLRAKDFGLPLQVVNLR